MNKSARTCLSKLALSLVSAFVLCFASGPIVTAQAVTLNFAAIFSGSSENPPVATPGTGAVNVLIDTSAFTMQIDLTFSGLVANATAAHIHCCTAPQTPAAPKSRQVITGL